MIEMPMKIPGFLISLLTAASVVITAGFASATVTVGEDDCGQPLTMEIAERLEVTLAGNPTTGFMWQTLPPLPPNLRQEGEPSFKQESALIGAGGLFTFHFATQKEGEGDLKLGYRRPWEDKTPPARICSFKVVVRKQAEQVLAVYVSAAGEQMAARFDLPAKTVTVTLPDGHVATLPTAVSASGARYSNGKETFWEHQGTGRFFVKDDLQFEGAQRAAGTSAPTGGSGK